MPEFHYISLLRLKLNHEYYTPAVMRDLKLAVPIETQRKLYAAGLLYRPADDGCHLVAESIDNGGTLEMTRPIEEDLKLSFFLKLQNPLFLNTTEGDRAFLGENLFYFNSNSANSTSEGEEMLNGPLLNPVTFTSGTLSVSRTNSSAAKLQVTGPDAFTTVILFTSPSGSIYILFNPTNPGLYTLQELDATDAPLGTPVDVYYHPEAKSHNPIILMEVIIAPPVDLLNPTTYLFNFEARKVLWRYQIYKHDTPSPLGSIDSYTSLAVDASSSDLPVSFSAASGTDPVIIESSGSIKLREKPYRPIQLQNGPETVLQNLANPDVSRLQQDGSQWVSNINLNLYI